MHCTFLYGSTVWKSLIVRDGTRNLFESSALTTAPRDPTLHDHWPTSLAWRKQGIWLSKQCYCIALVCCYFLEFLGNTEMQRNKWKHAIFVLSRFIDYGLGYLDLGSVTLSNALLCVYAWACAYWYVFVCMHACVFVHVCFACRITKSRQPVSWHARVRRIIYHSAGKPTRFSVHGFFIRSIYGNHADNTMIVMYEPDEPWNAGHRRSSSKKNILPLSSVCWYVCRQPLTWLCLDLQ